jgi:hypothetical protein
MNDIILGQFAGQCWYQILSSDGVPLTDWQYGDATPQGAIDAAEIRFGKLRHFRAATYLELASYWNDKPSLLEW